MGDVNLLLISDSFRLHVLMEANGHEVLSEALEAVMGLLRDLPDWDREVLEANHGVKWIRG
jgi:hypothetical protein